MKPEKIKCKKCGGKGKHRDESKCKWCSGTGFFTPAPKDEERS